MGYGPKKTECQDAFYIYEGKDGAKLTEDCYFFSVFDGHGSSGKEASNSVQEFFLNYLEKNIK